MSFLNLMGNKLKPKEVNDALLSDDTSSASGGDTPSASSGVKTFTWNGDGDAPHTKQIPDDVGIILDIEQNDTGEGAIVSPFVLKPNGKYMIINRTNGTITPVGFSYSNGNMTFGSGAVGVDVVFNRGGNSYTMYYLPIETN